MVYTAVLEAFGRLRRASFMDTDAARYADLDRALPIGYGQTISQPSLVIEMTGLLQVEPGLRVLEIGTGSAFQTALLLEMGATVYTVERVAELHLRARERLAAFGYSNVFLRHGDGSAGWPEEAPFDRILVTAAAREVPDELRQQLGQGGRMVIPVGPQGGQVLLLIVKDDFGQLSSHNAGYVSFVEMKGKYGWRREE